MTTALQKARTGPERVAAAIRLGIVQRRYLVGQHLVEAELMKELDVGRSTVREALKLLSATGAITIVPHKGAVICALTKRDAIELLTVVEVLGGLAARLAAQNIALGNNRSRFENAAARVLVPNATHTQLARMLDGRADFYAVLFQIAANGELNRALPLTRAGLLRTQLHNLLTYEDQKRMRADYRAVARAILAADPKGAEQAMRKHMQNTIRIVEMRLPDER